MSPAPTSDLLLPNEHYITSLSTGEPVCQNHNYASDEELVEHIERMAVESERERLRWAVRALEPCCDDAKVDDRPVMCQHGAYVRDAILGLLAPNQ